MSVDILVIKKRGTQPQPLCCWQTCYQAAHTTAALQRPDLLVCGGRPGMGYDVVRFEGTVDEELICPICSAVLEDPRLAPE